MAATAWRPAFSISTIDGIPIVLHRPAIRLSHLLCVEHAHRRSSVPLVLDFVNEARRERRGRR